MKQRIIEAVDKWRSEIPQRPIAVFDREGYDKGFLFLNPTSLLRQ